MKCNVQDAGKIHSLTNNVLYIQANFWWCQIHYCGSLNQNFGPGPRCSAPPPCLQPNVKVQFPYRHISTLTTGYKNSKSGDVMGYSVPTNSQTVRQTDTELEYNHLTDSARRPAGLFVQDGRRLCRHRNCLLRSAVFALSLRHSEVVGVERWRRCSSQQPEGVQR